jgi:hypothetical protein
MFGVSSYQASGTGHLAALQQFRKAFVSRPTAGQGQPYATRTSFETHRGGDDLVETRETKVAHVLPEQGLNSRRRFKVIGGKVWIASKSD